jgi:pSer/pThr/pTyr-binding forkhead associated (FHA) protein
MMNNKAVGSPTEGWLVRTTPRLVVISGPLANRTFDLEEPLVSIGRESSTDIRLDDPFVSRHHCVIRNEGDRHLIEDLNSANGNFVDGERVKASPLKEDSLIQIGASLFLFRLQSSDESKTSSHNLIAAENISDGRRTY